MKTKINTKNVSTILPVYYTQKRDQFKFTEDLTTAISSVLSQGGNHNIEIICIDDGSEIPLNELLQPTGLLENSQIRIVCHARNYGLVHALNTGLEAARYDLIARIDCDDLWLPGKLEKQTSLFEKDPDLTLVATGMRVMTNPPQDHLRQGSWKSILSFFEEVGCPFPHGSILARKDVFRVLGGYSHAPNTRHCEDYALWGSWIRFFKPAIIEEILFEYRPSENSVSTLFSQQQQKISGEVNQQFRNIPFRHNIPENIQELSNVLKVSVLEAGFIAADIAIMENCFYEVPVNALPILRRLIPEKSIRETKTRDANAWRRNINRIASINAASTIIHAQS